MEDNEELIKAWIGEKKQEERYQDLMIGGFSLKAFLFTKLYLLSKKMYLEFTIYIAICILINVVQIIVGFQNVTANIFNKSIEINIVIIVIKLIMGFMFFTLYKKHIFRKIKKYKKKGLSDKEQLSIAKRKGGSHSIFEIILVWVGIIIVFLPTIFVFLIIALIGELIWGNSYYNTIYNLDGTKSFIVDEVRITGEANDWEIGRIGQHRVLKYRKNKNYISYVQKRVVDNKEIMESLDNEAFRKEYKKEIEEQSRKKGLKLKNIEYNKVNENLYEITAIAYTENSKVMVYSHITDSYRVIFNIVSMKEDLVFENKAKKMLRNLKIEDQYFNGKYNNEENTLNSNENDIIIDIKKVKNLKFGLPAGYNNLRVDKDDVFSCSNEKRWTSIFVDTMEAKYNLSFEHYIKQYIKEINSINELEIENIRGVTWRKYRMETTYGIQYYYFAEYGEDFYIIMFSIINEKNEDIAIKDLEKIKNSFSFE